MGAESVVVRKVDDQLAVEIPLRFAEALGIAEGSRVELRVDDGRLIVRRSHRIGLAARLAMCTGGSLSDEEREWLNAPPVGREVI